VTEEAKRLESNRSHDVGAHHALRSIRAAKVQSATEHEIVFAFESAGGSSRSGNGSSGGSGWRRSRAGAAGDGRHWPQDVDLGGSGGGRVADS
jgi:hypothetical protein